MCCSGVLVAGRHPETGEADVRRHAGFIELGISSCVAAIVRLRIPFEAARKENFFLG